MKYTLRETAVIILDSVLGLEYNNKRTIFNEFPNAEELFEGSDRLKNALNGILGESKANTVFHSLTDKDYRDFVLQGLEKYRTECVVLGSEYYPDALSHTDLKPFVLYCNGNKELLKSDKMFGVVGSRKCLPYATDLAQRFSERISSAGGVIVTGSAGGADRAAMDGAINSGRIISVLAGGIAHVYPEYNRSVIEKISEFGLVFSEQPPDYPVKPWMFPMRNRLIAGLSKGVLIVGGDRKSGARYTAEFAAEYGREVFAFPYSLGIKSGELNNDLIKNGCALCDGFDEIFELLGLSEEPSEDASLSDEELLVLNAVKDGADSVPKLIEKTGMKMRELAPILSSLEIQGLVARMLGNLYKAVG